MHLPPELWCKILEDVDAKTLPNVSLTCRDFHSIARPLIFRNFRMRIQRGVSPGQSARLDFYASDVIAPFVRELFIVDAQLGMDLDTLDLIFDALPRFINAQWLMCTHVNFTQFTIEQISSLPSLSRLCLIECKFPPNIEPMRLLRIHNFSYHYVQVADPMAHRWLELLDFNHLQFLLIPLTPALFSFFMAIDNPYLFPSLHALYFDLDPELLLQLPIILSKTPALRRLKLYLLRRRSTLSTHSADAFALTNSCSVPNLEQYNGPHDFLHVIQGRKMDTPSTRLRRLYLDSISGVGDPLNAHIDTLTSCRPHLRNLTHLHISMLKSMELKSLAVLKDMCPLLQELLVHNSKRCCSGEFIYDVSLNDLHTLPLPDTLVSVSIQWTSHRDVPDLVAAKDSLLPRLPSLRRVWLCDWSQMALLWHRTSAKDHCAVHEVGPRKTNYDAWMMRVVAFPEDPIFLW